ncbi:hypothetical protein KP509_05G009800 [Ceratopteris richardii]|uniref:Surfeit locus protein 2 n=1 Tax=Ceratopteris richardii TaxID=49495 RepID=A0A8T2UJ94_CERRI|nr:hypothetical protein KP509_05G009800 [Ceratopteris richardii]
MDCQSAPNLLGDVHFEDLLGKPGRVRCIETGHELLVTEKEAYSQSKKCRRILFDLCLAQRKPPLNVFEQNPTFKDKVICKLTGDLLNKSEDAIWRHMNGKKFLRKLAEKEEKRSHVRKSDESMDAEQIGDKDLSVVNQTEADHTSHIIDEDVESMEIEDPDFWVPPSIEQDSDCSEGTDEMSGKGPMSGKCTASGGLKRKLDKGQKARGVTRKKLRSHPVC